MPGDLRYNGLSLQLRMPIAGLQGNSCACVQYYALVPEKKLSCHVKTMPKDGPPMGHFLLHSPHAYTRKGHTLIQVLPPPNAY